MQLDDTHLTYDGLDAPASGRVLLLACGALAHEILALIRLNGWQHMTLQCLPAILHNHPERIADAVEQVVRAQRDRFDDIFVVYADCGTGGQLQQRCADLGVTMMPGPHCYAFFDGVDQFTTRDETTAFYLTDFLTRQFDAFVWKPLGLDRFPQLRDDYFGSYESLIYLAQTEDETLTQKARDCADRLGLQFKRRYTGYGDLMSALQSVHNNT